ncbi:MAG: hypothetical protein WAU92_06535, partial [Candidatus Sulfotelmatobacter sp.]
MPLQARSQTQSATGTSGSSLSSPTLTAPALDPSVDAAYDHFYNMDYDRAIQEFEKVLDRRPNDPSPVNHLLATILMRELYR